MKNFKSKEMKNAYILGGFRERFAMENGNKTTLYINGHKLFKFTYSHFKTFQDGNGATYDATAKRWIS